MPKSTLASVVPSVIGATIGKSPAETGLFTIVKLAF